MIKRRLSSSQTDELCAKQKGKHTIYRAILVFISLSDHLVDFFFGEILAEGFHDLAEFIGRDCAAAVLVEDVESGTCLMGEILRLDRLRHHLQEFLEVDATAGVDIDFVDLNESKSQSGWIYLEMLQTL